MLAYILDVLGSHPAAFGTSWASLLISNVVILIGGVTGGQDAPLLVSLAIVTGCGLVLLCVACWATLQFDFAIKGHRPAVAAVEKFLLGTRCARRRALPECQ